MLFEKQAALDSQGGHRVEHFSYLDYAASAPLRPEARTAWLSYHDLPCSDANPNSLHTLGREAARHLDAARRTLAHSLGGSLRPTEIIFTSGGTESNDLALLGLAEGIRRRDRSRTRIVLSAIEHDSIRAMASNLRGRGFEIEFARPNRDGILSADEVMRAAGDHCAFVSVMAANNETGIIQPIDEIVAHAHARGIYVHVDAIQAFGHIPLTTSGVSALSIAAHKIGGPVGIGALALRTGVPFEAPTVGGGQESGKRPGTQDVAGACAFAAAAHVVCSDLATTRAQVEQMSRHVYERLCGEKTGIVPTTSIPVGEHTLPGMVSIMVPDVDSETLVLQLDAQGFEVSAGSACASASLEPSHVLSAMGIARNDALGSLRISFDERVELDELDAFCDALLELVTHTQYR